MSRTITDLRCCAISSTATRRLSRIIAQTSSIQCFPLWWMWTGLLIILHKWHFCHRFFNMIISLNTLHWDRALFPYCAEGALWFLSQITVSVHKIRVTAGYFSLVHAESEAAMLTATTCPGNVESISKPRMDFMLLPARKISNAANTTSFNINYCGSFLTYLRILPNKDRFRIIWFMFTIHMIRTASVV
jgi:hypothetical protein